MITLYAMQFDENGQKCRDNIYFKNESEIPDFIDVQMDPGESLLVYNVHDGTLFNSYDK